MEKEKKPIYKKWWFWIIIVILVVGIFGGNSNNTTNINTSNTNTIQIDNEEKVIFLKGSNGKEFFNILCEVAEVSKKEGVPIAETIDYTSSNEKYGIELETNQNNEINWISIYTMLTDKNDYENFFMAISRLEYDSSNKAKCFNWIHDNLGKEAATKIGDANFRLYNGASGNPILEVFTDGNEDYQKKLVNRISN